MNLNQVTLPATDMQQSVQFYRNMGFIQIVAAEDYARFECPEGDATLSIHKVKRAADPGVIVYFECSDLDQRVAGLQAKGFSFLGSPRDERWLWREARLRDPAGNLLCLFFAGENRKNPPWRINHRPTVARHIFAVRAIAVVLSWIVFASAIATAIWTSVPQIAVAALFFSGFLPYLASLHVIEPWLLKKQAVQLDRD